MPDIRPTRYDGNDDRDIEDMLSFEEFEFKDNIQQIKFKIGEIALKSLRHNTWTLEELKNVHRLVEDFSDEAYAELTPKEKLDLVWTLPLVRPYGNDERFGSFFGRMVEQEIKMVVVETINEKIKKATVDFNENKEEDKNEVSETSLVGEPPEERAPTEESDCEE